METNKNKFIEDWGSARENLEHNFRWTRRNFALIGIFGIALPIIVYKGIVKDFVSSILSICRFDLQFDLSVRIRNVPCLFLCPNCCFHVTVSFEFGSYGKIIWLRFCVCVCGTFGFRYAFSCVWFDLLLPKLLKRQDWFKCAMCIVFKGSPFLQY